MDGIGFDLCFLAIPLWFHGQVVVDGISAKVNLAHVVELSPLNGVCTEIALLYHYGLKLNCFIDN